MQPKYPIMRSSSMEDGILFFSERHPGFLTWATLDKDGRTMSALTVCQVHRFSEHFLTPSFDQPHKKKFSHPLIVLIVTVAAAVFAYFYIMVRLSAIGSVRFLLSLYLFAMIAPVIWRHTRSRRKKSAYRFNLAKCMVINAYNTLGRVPTLEEIQQYSHFSKSCSINTPAFITIAFTLMLISSFVVPEPYCLLGLIFSPLVSYVLIKLGLLRFFQVLTSLKPIDTELLVAIKGMNAWLENEKSSDLTDKVIILDFTHKDEL